MKDSQNGQSQAFGFLFTCQHIFSGDQIAVMPGVLFAGILQENQVFNDPLSAFVLPQHQASPFFRIGLFRRGYESDPGFLPGD